MADTERVDSVADYTIPKDTENWDVPLNANLTDINNRLTSGENQDTTQDGQISTLQTQMTAANSNIATNTANIATVTTTANAAVPKDRLVVNVKDHGAAGDGVTDDASSISAALTVLGSAGGVLYFPPGNYLVNSNPSLSIANPVTIQGAGPGASSIRIGASMVVGTLFTVSSDDVVFQDIQIRGNSSTVTSNPAMDGITATGVKAFKMLNVEMQFINGYAVKLFASSTNTIHGGQFDNIKIQSCAGGIYVKGDNASGNVAANVQLSNIFTRFLGLNSGGSANLDGVRIEDAWDVLAENVISWMNATTGGTGVAFRVVGNCAATFILNLDALGPQTGSANVSIEGNANGSPQNVQITGGVIQQGTVGLNIQDAATQVRVGSVRFINNQTHGATVSSTGPAIYFDSVFFSGNGAGATGTNYDLNWSGTTTGFVTNCRFASPIVSTGTAGVQKSINVAASQNVRFWNADFQGTGAAQANWFTNLPAAAHTIAGGNWGFLTNTDFNYSTGPGRVSIMPFAAGNNCLSLNVQGNDANDRFRLTGDGKIAIGPGSAGRDTSMERIGTAQYGSNDSDIVANLAGKTFKVKSGTNAKAGTVTANGTTAVTVSTTAITANSVVVFGLKTQAGTAATSGPFMSAVTAGTSFQIKSTAGDTSVYNWVILDLI